jgi:hypothetical protein
MELIANGLNGVYLRNYLPMVSEDVDIVLASVAYGSDSSTFLENAVANRWRVDIWMRYDHTVPVSIPLMRWLLANHRNSIFCKLVPDVLHSKVIWWKGHGAYIGSANLSDRAWNSNIEAGLFLSSSELAASGIDAQLETYFAALTDLPQAFALTTEVVDELEAMEKLRRNGRDLEERLKKLRKIPTFSGLNFIDHQSAYSRAEQSFLLEWNETLTHMRAIAEQIIEHRPGWVREDIPPAWQADQFLHAFYYNKVRDGAKYPFEEMYKQNHADPWLATSEAMEWWSKLTEPPSHEDETFYKLAPLIRSHLARENIDSLGHEQFTEICRATHATFDHVSKIPLSEFGIEGQTSMPWEERVPIFAEWLLKKRNRKEQDVIKLIKWVFYGGAESEIPHRLFTAARDKNYSIAHYGLNSLAEVVGWALPESVPPRNGRTSKALRALGFNASVY